MKLYLLALLLSISTTIMAMPPLFTCKNAEHSLTLTISNKTEGHIVQKNATCPIKIVEFESSRGKVSKDHILINFEVHDCHNNIFYKKGFLQISTDKAKSGFISNILALRGIQTFECESTGPGIERLLTL